MVPVRVPICKNGTFPSAAKEKRAGAFPSALRKTAKAAGRLTDGTACPRHRLSASIVGRFNGCPVETAGPYAGKGKQWLLSTDGQSPPFPRRHYIETWFIDGCEEQYIFYCSENAKEKQDGDSPIFLPFLRMVWVKQYENERIGAFGAFYHQKMERSRPAPARTGIKRRGSGRFLDLSRKSAAPRGPARTRAGEIGAEAFPKTPENVKIYPNRTNLGFVKRNKICYTDITVKTAAGRGRSCAGKAGRKTAGCCFER